MFRFLRFRRINREITTLLDELSPLLSEDDVRNVREMLEHNELGIALEILVTQLYEFERPITAATYRRIESLAQQMAMPAREWGFARELIRD